MFEGRSVAAVVVAAGSGTRMGGPVPKQYLEIEGTPVLVHAVRALLATSVVDALVVVVAAGSEPEAAALMSRFGLDRVRIVPGGAERQNSVGQALRSLSSNPPDLVLIHDAVRPCVTGECILAVLHAAIQYGASTAGVIPKDTLKQVDTEDFVLSTPERSRLRLIQTPQGFGFSLLQEAHARAEKDGFLGTDDAVLVERLGKKVKVVEGSYQNIKITTLEDIPMAASCLRSKGKNA
jgi:2-C-methyl-D-erythritol 4-phosphate cytidylyltransferase